MHARSSLVNREEDVEFERSFLFWRMPKKMKFIKIKPIVLAVFCSFAFSETVTAQYVPTPPVYTQDTFWTNLWQNKQYDRVTQSIVDNQRMANRRIVGSKRGGTTQPRSRYANVWVRAFKFTRSTPSPLAELIYTELGKKSNISQNDAEQLVGNMWERYQISLTEEAGLGMPLNDVASAMTYYIVVNYLNAYDLQTIPAENSFAVYAQIADAFNKDKAFSTLSPKEKQLTSEVLLTITGMPRLEFERDKDRDKLRRGSHRNLAALFHDSAKNLKITQKGIEF